MTQPTGYPRGNRLRSSAAKGFVLVITLSLMILLGVLVVSLLTLSTFSLRSSSLQNAQSTARANARMAMIIAIGELQKATGPDQRVTMTSDLGTGLTPANPNWTGVTDVSPAALTPDAKSAPIRWLVSGVDPDPAQPLSKSTDLNQGDALKLGTFHISPTETKELLAPLVNVSGGRYAWWIGDEGTKARVDVAKSKTDPSTDLDRLAKSQSPLEGGFGKLGAEWAGFAPGGAIEKSALVSLQTVSLAAENKTLASRFFNDVTIGGYGLPVNVTTGGMKADLSLIFDKSQAAKNFGQTYFGATASAASVDGVPVRNFTVSSPAKFYLSDAISKNASLPTGPNWGNLWNYATLWQNVGNQQIQIVGANPLVESELRFKTWLPYTNHNQGDFRRDIQQTNSPVAPVLSMFQIGFRLNSELMPPASPTATPIYKAQIGIQPVVGLWNPYNVTIKAAPYLFDWAIYPFFQFNYAKPNGSGGFTDGRNTNLWLREVWTAGAGIPTPENGEAGRWLQLATPAVDLQPGEFRLFSVVDRIRITSGQAYTLQPGWSEKGSFIVDLRDDNGNVRLVPEGYRAWFGTLLLQDTQSNAIKTKFPTVDLNNLSSTWLTFKSGNKILYRAIDLWNSGSDPAISTPIRMPEPVLSGSDGGLNTTKTTYLIEDLAGDRVTPNIATWSFFLRTSNQIESPDVNQRLRGWIDSNPRALVTNALWDGSKVGSSGQRSGWHTTSPFIGAWNAPGRPGVVGDGLGGNRGLLSEGGSAVSEPEVNKAGGRYQGYGGASNTFAGGRTHVIAFDVPRSPLVSLGQFQHAQLSRYNFEPGFVFGNSYANPRIPLNATTHPNFSGINGLNVTDVSFDVNKKLWDGFFFSTLGIDYVGGSGSSFDNVFDINKLASSEATLPNPRMQFVPLGGDTSLDKILAGAAARAPEAIAARILVKGAFNVNSTSKTAWKAVLSSMTASQLPVVNPQTGALSWENPDGIRFNRFGHVLTNTAYEKGGAGDENAFWQGWRNLSEDELDLLATEIVKEVKARGPFRSMAEFVNRNPNASSTEHQLKGALQAALDRAINTGFPSSIGKAAVTPPGADFSAAITGESTAAGSAAYLLQGDVLQSLAPILQVRSDYFRIRTCGEALDANGNVIARAWCEAFVQRTGGYLDPQDAIHETPAELASETNKTHGRSYQIVSFRWLSEAEI
ncbi:MAG: hypothetical protein RLZZ505_1199 [Verrucomicrobiota bacterium]|jgi:hypothetical protein